MNIDDYEKTGHARFARLAKVVEDILRHALLQSDSLANIPQVQSRAKGPASLRLKLSKRGKLDSDVIEDEIKDLGGCRIIFYTNVDLDRFRTSDFWRANFDVDWLASKTHFPRAEDASVDELYQGVHYVVRLKTDRTQLVEYADLAGLRCEIQLQTILNHAWSETSHDVLYKTEGVQGFGSRQRETLKKLFARVMREHLVPAGYEMDKIQSAAERLRTGQAVFDGAPLDQLGKAKDNNERVDILQSINSHMLPLLDDISVHIRDIRNSVVLTVEAARTVPVVARSGLLRGFRGDSSIDVLKRGLEILDALRHGYIEEAFHALLRMWEGTAEQEDRKLIEASLGRMARYSIPIWKAHGAEAQVALTEELEALGSDRRLRARPLVLVVCDATLGTEMDHAEATSFDTITFSKATVTAHGTLVVARQNAIRFGLEILEASTTTQEWRVAWKALWRGTAAAVRGNSDASLVRLQLDLMRTLCGVATRCRSCIPYDVVQEIEEDLYWAHRRLGRNEADTAAISDEVRFDVAETRTALKASRDAFNTDERYVTYKTLVGFRTIFIEEWDREIEIGDKETLREARIDAYAATVSPSTRDYWLGVVVQCAETESNDLATFPPLIKFFKALARVHPKIALDLLMSGGKPLERFAPAFMPVLLNTEARQDTLAVMKAWMSLGRSAAALGRALFLIDEAFADLIIETGDAVVGEKYLPGCYEIAHAALRHGSTQNDLWTDVLIPSLAVLTEAGDGTFADSYLIDDALETRLDDFPAGVAAAMLDNFVCCSDIGYNEQGKLAHLAKSHSELVWSMFQSRLKVSQSKSFEDRYEAVPQNWHGLEKVLGADATCVFKRVRGWPEGQDGSGRFAKAEFLAKMFHECSDEFVASVIKIIREEGAGAVPFACEVLRQFDGNERVYSVCQVMAEVVGENEDVIYQIRSVIEATGVTSGEFGRAEAMEAKAERLKSWLEHRDPKVQKFAHDFISDLDKIALDERRRGTERRERRRRDFDDPE